jgi:hypothetical protein
MSMDFIREQLEDPDSKKAEALAWLKGNRGRNTVGEGMTNQESVALIEETTSSFSFWPPRYSAQGGTPAAFCPSCKLFLSCRVVLVTVAGLITNY